MKLVNFLQQFLRNSNQSAQMAVEIRTGLANHSELVNRKFDALIPMIENLNQSIANLNHSINNLNHQDADLSGFQSPPGAAKTAPTKPLLFSEKTLNVAHPDYNADLVRNFPGKLFNMDTGINNVVYDELKKMILGNEISEDQWQDILKQSLAELKAIPHAEQLFQRIAYVENYMTELGSKYGSVYRPGWVNLDDAIFLYWVVRNLKPKTIVQTGVCNGLSAAFMVLAMVKNGGEGNLHTVDLAPTFNADDPAWTAKGEIYGVTIPEGKTSGWLVPDAYQDRFSVIQGDAKLMLPELLKKLGSIDMFYHDSDHTYEHMMFEFMEAKKYLSKSGVFVADDISWNASLWDFADEYQVPAYNYRGSVGIACF
ncbi:MAG: class I SAM-dependent methyltransferase [Gammaproteobacteria bacterium]|nr:class I SAM-dependent methyltransferase [Gammaproteobacteria bacterium]